jgi:hypothetical protein
MVTIKIKQQALMVELASEDLKKKNKKTGWQGDATKACI